jgi:hypothetical protein
MPGAPTIPLTDTQNRILASLCRPLADGSRFATPATNQEIADEVFLSVDAVKAHLRTLYRKFGIEDLPHNQKRARLTELVLEGGYLGATPVPDEVGEEARPPVPPSPGPRSAPPRGIPVGRKLWIAAGALVAAVVVLAVLAIAGVFSSDSSGTTTGLAAYRSAVRGYCRLALSGARQNPGGSREQKAGAYLEVIETMRGRLESLPPPSGSDRDLERFREGLTGAANFTSVVAEGAPPAGTPTEADIVAQLTFAAGQVQAGALGYGLGQNCQRIGDLVAESAANAAAAP